jgi:hypothetical protein
MLPVQCGVLSSQGEQRFGNTAYDRIDAEEITILGAPKVERLQHEGRRPENLEGNFAVHRGPMGIDVEEETFNG